MDPTGADTPARPVPARRAARAVRQMGDAALRAALLRAVVDTLTADLNAARDELGVHLRAAYGGFKVKTIDVELPGVAGPVATATLTATTTSTTVADPAVLHAWVAQHYPEALVTIVDPAFTQRLLTELVPDPATKDLVHRPTGTPAPWARRQPGGPAYPTVRFTTDGRDTLIAAWRAGQLTTLAPSPAVDDGQPSLDEPPRPDPVDG